MQVTLSLSYYLQCLKYKKCVSTLYHQQSQTPVHERGLGFLYTGSLPA